ncbi:MAG: HAD family hydrolase [Bdellovibrionales bacterium]
MKLTDFDAIFFDLDGTIVDSCLDFSLFKEIHNINYEHDILSYRDSLDCLEKIEDLNKKIIDFENEGAKASKIIPGAISLLENIRKLEIPTGLLTRNCRSATNISLRKHKINFESIITREDAPPKPDPTGLLLMAKRESVVPKNCVYIGDYIFDIETAKNAGMKSCLLLNERNTEFSKLADFTIECFSALNSKDFNFLKAN